MESPIIEPGMHFSEALNGITYDADTQREITRTITALVQDIVTAYVSSIGSGIVGRGGSGLIGDLNEPAPVGLIYGRIQSGKTRAMILSAAMAMDNHFRIAVILTSNVNRLVEQTHEDFQNGLTTVPIFSKSDLKGAKLELLRRQLIQGLQDDTFNAIIIASKGKTVLEELVSLLGSIDAQKFPAVIYDDEGDQATLDTNTGRRAAGHDELPMSTIHGLVHGPVSGSIRAVMPASVFVSVTGTPQAIFLQNADSGSRLKFVHLLEAGEGYTGGDLFFGPASEAANRYVEQLGVGENIQISSHDIPDGLKHAINFFIVAATAAGLKDGWNSYKMLCHTSANQKDHQTVTDLVSGYVENVVSALRNPGLDEHRALIEDLKSAYAELTLTATDIASFEEICDKARTQLLFRQSFTINSKSSNEKFQYSKSYNFLIGGNTVGRGLAIGGLLVTYYTREPKSAKADTMYQHARMFGYREATLPYTRVFMPDTLYRRFREIWLSDEEARAYIREHGFDAVGALMLKNAEPGIGLKATRNNVLDPRNVNVIHAGKAIYPKHPRFRPGEADDNRHRFDTLIRRIAPRFSEQASGSVIISATDAEKLSRALKSNDLTGSWADKQVGNYFKTFADRLDTDRVRLEWRESDRRLDDGYLDNGVHGTEELRRWRTAEIPTLLVAKMHADGIVYYYPTITAPETLSSYIFNRT